MRVARSARLRVDALHTLSIVRYSPPSPKRMSTNGRPLLPVIVIHGGPGGAKSTKYLSYLPKRTLERMDVVLYDQRGCGRSTPLNETRRNTVALLVHDVERVRQYIRNKTGSAIWDSVCVYGASYGATLAVLYASQYPKYTKCVVAHGFTRLQNGLFSNKLMEQHPHIWKAWLSTISTKLSPLSQPPASFYRSYGILLRDKKRLAPVRRWCALESRRTLYATRRRNPKPSGKRQSAGGKRTLALIECHFAQQKLPQRLNDVHTLSNMIGDVPVFLTHGKQDCICNIEDSYALNAALQNSQLWAISDAGHALLEANTARALRNIFASLVRNAPATIIST